MSEVDSTTPASAVATDYSSRSISFYDVVERIAKHGKVLLISLFAFLTVAILAAWLMRPIYRAEVTFIPATDDSGSGGLSGLAEQFGGLAALTGISIPSTDSSSTEALAVLQGRSLVDDFIIEENLLPILFESDWDAESGQWKTDPPTMGDAYELFDKKIRMISEDAQLGVYVLSIDWHDREEAARWANELISRLNERMRQREIEQSQNSLEYLREQLQQTGFVELQQAIYELTKREINKDHAR